MQNESTLIDNVVTALQAIPGVVSLLGNSAANVRAYKRSYPLRVSLEQAVHEMNPPSIMVAHLRTFFARNIDHQLAIFMKPTGSPDDLFAAIREGIPAGFGGVPFKRALINQACHPPFIQQYSPRAIAISDGAFIEIYEATLSLTERGADI
jgi:hypothetical protein